MQNEKDKIYTLSAISQGKISIFGLIKLNHQKYGHQLN